VRPKRPIAVATCAEELGWEQDLFLQRFLACKKCGNIMKPEDFATTSFTPNPKWCPKGGKCET